MPLHCSLNHVCPTVAGSGKIGPLSFNLTSRTLEIGWLNIGDWVQVLGMNDVTAPKSTRTEFLAHGLPSRLLRSKRRLRSPFSKRKLISSDSIVNNFRESCFPSDNDWNLLQGKFL